MFVLLLVQLVSKPRCVLLAEKVYTGHILKIEASSQPARACDKNPDCEMRMVENVQILANPSSFDVAVTTYDMIKSKDLGHSLKRTIHWRYLVLDEGHKIKNEDTLISHSMRHVRSAVMSRT
jgi:hypothetical protein